MTAKTSAVFDCVVYLQAAASNGGPSAACMRAVRSGDVQLFVSDLVLAELADALWRTSIRRKLPRLTPQVCEEFLCSVREVATHIEARSLGLRFARDPDDIPYIELAIQSQAQFLVTRDADLLSIPSSTDPDALRIRQLAPNIQIVDPVQFLAALPTR